MVHRGQVLADDSLTLEFTATASDTDGALHEMRARYAPGAPFPPAHHHPGQDEHFRVEAGELVFDVDGKEQVVGAGGDITIPRGAVHRVRNAGTVPAVALWQTRPALRTGEFLERVTQARTAGGVLHLLAVVGEYDDVYRLAVRPRWLTAGAVRLLAPLARTRTRRGSSRRPAA